MIYIYVIQLSKYVTQIGLLNLTASSSMRSSSEILKFLLVETCESTLPRESLRASLRNNTAECCATISSHSAENSRAFRGLVLMKLAALVTSFNTVFSSGLICLVANASQNQNQNQKSFNVPQTGTIVCHSSDRILQKQKHITRTGTIVKISNKIRKGRNRHIHIFT